MQPERSNAVIVRRKAVTVRGRRRTSDKIAGATVMFGCLMALGFLPA
jgi:hypothetical protein